MITEKLTKEIAALDTEAREAMDRLANKREELERQHQATELAAARQQEREEERRRQEQEEAERKAEEEARARREEIAEEGRELSAELEGLADRILETLERLQELDRRMVDEVALYDTERANSLVRACAGRHRRWSRKGSGGSSGRHEDRPRPRGGRGPGGARRADAEGVRGGLAE